MPNEPRRQVQDILMTCAQAQYNDLQETTPRGHTISTMTTSTFTAATVTSSLVGCIAMPADGLRDYARMVKSVSGTTATVDKAWSSTSGVTTIRTWLPPEVPARAAAGGNTLAFISSAHTSITNEPANYWDFSTKSYFVLGYTGTNAGVASKISAFSTSGQFTLVSATALLGVPADGDLFLIRKTLRPEAPVEATVNQKTVTRRIVGQKDADQAVPVTVEGSVAFTLPQRPIGTAGTAGANPTAPVEIGEMLEDFMTVTLQPGMTVSSATGNTVTVSSATASVGGFILCNTGEAAQLLSLASTTYTVGSGQLTTASVSGTALGSAWYQFKTADFRNRLFDFYRGRIQRQLFYGCVPTVDIEVSRDQVVKFNFKYSAASAFEYSASDPNTAATRRFPFAETTVPFDGKAARFCMNGTRVLCGDLKVNLGIAPVPRPTLGGVNQADGMAVDLTPVTFTTSILADQDDVSGFEILSDRIRGGDILQLLYQKGSTQTNTFCIGMPSAQLTKAVFGYNGGQGEWQLEGVCVNAPSTGLGDTIPAFSMAWL